MNKPFISIVIPIYNKSGYIKQSVESLMKQTYSDIEIVCVDDKSKDDSLAIVEEFVIKDKRIRVLKHKVNSGTMKARYTGVKAATGQYIMFLDADDELELYACEKLYNTIKIHNADIYGFGATKIHSDNISCIKNNIYLETYSGYLYGIEILEKSFIDTDMTWHVWDKIYTSKLCKRVYDIIYNDHQERNVNPITEDAYAFMVLAYHAKSFYGFQESIYKYYYGRGVMGSEQLNLERFERYCMSAVDVEYFHKFFTKEGVFEQYNCVINSFRTKLIRLCTDAWENQIPREYKAEALKIMVCYWSYIELFEWLSSHWDTKYLYKSWTPPYSKLPQKGRIILYGAGEIGKDYYRQLTETNYCKIVLWVDKNYALYQNSNMPIHSPNEIAEKDFDCVLIAVFDSNSAYNIRQYLSNTLNVPEDVII